MNVDSKSGRGLPVPFARIALVFAMFSPGIRAGEPEEGRVHEVNLVSGARLIGEVKGHQPDEEWVLESPDAAAPIRLKPGAVRSFSRLAGGDAAENAPAATFIFLSGDRIPAGISAFDGSTFEVRAPWAGEPRSVKWDTLRGIEFAEHGSRRLFAGPAPDQKWEFTAGPDRLNARAPGMDEGRARKEDSRSSPWKVESGALAAGGPGSASVDAGLPDQVSITFDLEWTGMLSMSMGMFSDAFLPSDQEEPEGPTVAATAAKNGEVIPMREGIAIDFNQHSVILRSHSPDQGQDMLGSGQMPPEYRGRTNARVTVRVDRANGACGIWFGDRQVQKWTELGNLGGKGKGLSFWQHHGNGSVTIRRLVARTWNGKFEEESPAAEEKRDILVAADGTRITGKLGSMTDGKFAMETSVGALDVAMGEIRHLIRAKEEKEEESEKSKPESGALITLAGGAGRFHIEEFRVESDGRLFIGKHAELGELALPAAEVDSVDFRTADEPATESGRRPVRNVILPGNRGNVGGAARPPQPRRQILPLLIPGLKK